jgi:hydrogenase nickel incorporation protein HypB
MCAICGCGERVEGADHHPRHHHHDHGHDHAGGMHVADLSQHRVIQIERNILGKNDEYAAANRARLGAAGVLALNLMSSPGSGKTTLLVRTITDLGNHYPIAVIEGDQQTSNDAERVRKTGAPAVQINTGKGCHLDAHMIAHALDALPLSARGLLFIENVGNLVCPAAFDLGEAYRIVMFSVTEGEDKPIKYPDMFAAADLMLINKADHSLSRLRPHSHARLCAPGQSAPRGARRVGAHRRRDAGLLRVDRALDRDGGCRRESRGIGAVLGRLVRPTLRELHPDCPSDLA